MPYPHSTTSVCRQYDFVNTEKLLGRSADQISSLVGYAGGEQGEDGKVCYYYAPEVSVYEKLGHAEVVQVGLVTPQGPPV